jgi:hypothetical protein
VHPAPITAKSLTTVPLRFVALALTVCVFVASGCESRNAGAVASPPKPAVTSPDEPTNALPVDFDKDLPIYPGATVEHVRRPKGAMREILFEADGPVEKLINFFRAGLDRHGFDITSMLQMKARRTWSCDFHKHGRQASILLYPNETDPSRITIDLIYEMPSRTTEAFVEPEEKFDVIGPGELARQNSETKKRN